MFLEAVLGLLLGDGSVICLLASQTLKLAVGTTKGFLFFREFVFAFSNVHLTLPCTLLSRYTLLVYCNSHSLLGEADLVAQNVGASCMTTSSMRQ